MEMAASKDQDGEGERAAPSQISQTRPVHRKQKAEISEDSSQSKQSPQRNHRGVEIFLEQLVMKIMQWAHTFLSCKMLFCIIIVDGAVQGAVNVVVVFMYKQVLDQLTESENSGLATFAGCCWIVREAQELGAIVFTVAQAMGSHYIGIWTATGVCFSALTWLCLYWTRHSLLSFFTWITVWELVALPIAAQLAVMDAEMDFHIKAKPFHRIWLLGFVAAVLLRDVDPYALQRRSDAPFGDRRLRVPWDPIFY